MDKPLPEDLLIEILLWLPVKSLFDFKIVSKRWYKTISSLCFRQLYQSQRKAEDDSLSSLLGFFQLEAQDALVPMHSLADKHYAKLPCSGGDGIGYLKLDGDSFISSSNGLLLYYNHHFMAYRVCNPVTKECLHLPEPQYNHFNAATGFDVEESWDNQFTLEQFKFKVVCLVPSSFTCLISDLQMEIFSSDTGYWSQCTLHPVHGSILLRPCEYAVIINGVYFWLECMNRVIEYDSNSNQGFEEDTLAIILLPERNIGITERSFVLGKSEDGLLQYGRSDSFKIVVWVLEGDMSNGDYDPQWVMRHTVSFMLMCHYYPDIMSSCDLILSEEALRNERNTNVPELVGFHPLNSSIIFIRLDKMIISCRLDGGRLELVPLEGINYILGKKSSSYLPGNRSNRLFPYFSPPWASFHL